MKAAAIERSRRGVTLATGVTLAMKVSPRVSKLSLRTCAPRATATSPPGSRRIGPWARTLAETARLRL
ncbi:hypothetical protein D3C80_2035320 [compost metagenome]